MTPKAKQIQPQVQTQNKNKNKNKTKKEKEKERKRQEDEEDYFVRFFMNFMILTLFCFVFFKNLNTLPCLIVNVHMNYHLDLDFIFFASCTIIVAHTTFIGVVLLL